LPDTGQASVLQLGFASLAVIAVGSALMLVRRRRLG
jgi:LPXTG-motif cell wall-anchored protein